MFKVTATLEVTNFLEADNADEAMQITSEMILNKFPHLRVRIDTITANELPPNVAL